MEKTTNFMVELKAEVLQEIRQHARSSMDAEVCGVLVGVSVEGVTKVEARIPGEGAAQGGAHVTFTHKTWEHIYRVKDLQFPKAAIVGWYHSHPGFGVFLSEYDLFIHRNFFSNPGQVAWVYDPHSDEEGCFIWMDGQIVRVSSLAVKDGRGVGGDSQQPKVEGKGAPVMVANKITQAKAAWWSVWLVRSILIAIGVAIGVLLGVLLTSFLQERGSSFRRMPAQVWEVFPDKGSAMDVLTSNGVSLLGTNRNLSKAFEAGARDLMPTNAETTTVRDTNVLIRPATGGRKP